MDSSKVEMYLMSNQKNFPSDKILFLKEKMLAADESKFQLATMSEIKDTTTMLLISLFLGSFGVDRFMLGDTGMGILKLLTGGLCGILTIIDWVTISKKTKELNFNNIMRLL